MPTTGPPLTESRSLDRLLDVGITTKPDEIALLSPGAQLTWRELDDASTRLARSYRRLGLEPGDRLASLMPNRVELVVHYLACFKAGIVATPLNYRYTVPQMDDTMQTCAARALVVHVERAADVAASADAQALELGVIWHDDDDPVDGGGEPSRSPALRSLIAADGSEGPELGPHDPSDNAAMFFTSGSTGAAKGVTHSRASLGWIFAITEAALDLTADDTYLPASSMSHVGGFRKTFSSLAIGARAVVAYEYDAGHVLQLLRDTRPTILGMLPSALISLIHDHETTAEDFSSLRIVAAAGDKVPVELDTELEHLTGLLVDEGYGMTEVGIVAMNPAHGEIRPGSFGITAPAVQLSVRDDDGNEVEQGTVGDLWIHTPALMAGYWNDPRATAQVVDAGWLNSGDEAHVDDDGYLWFFGRRKQIIIHDGSNISPLEVEEAVAAHPAVDLVAVIGIHDPMHGENVRAYVTIRQGAERPTAQELIDVARERIGYRAPEEIRFLDEMPLNPTGKVDRNMLTKLAADEVHRT